MSNPMKPVPAESIYYKLYKPSPMIVEDLIPKGLAVLGGTSKIGKSWMALDLAISVATGLLSQAAVTIVTIVTVLLPAYRAQYRHDRHCRHRIDLRVLPRKRYLCMATGVATRTV